MAVCVHCSAPIKELLLCYGPDHVVCTKCQSCGLFADPYVEQDAVIVAIDLILVKPRAYRHLLFNRPELEVPQWDEKGKRKISTQSALSYRSQLLRRWWNLFLCLLALTLVDSYLRWFYICSAESQKETSKASLLFHSSVTHHTTTIASYLRILRATCIQLGALFSATCLLSIFYCCVLKALSHRQKTGMAQNDVECFQPHLVLTSLFLAHLTPVFLLSLLLLWQTTQSPSAVKSGWQWDEDSIDWAIRSLVGGLSSGVALGVVLPLQKNKVGAFFAICILVTAWSIQMQVSSWLQVPFYSGVGVLQTSTGLDASRRYCH